MPHLLSKLKQTSRPILRAIIQYFIPGTFNTNYKSKMISRRQGGGDETYYTYVEKADDTANKDSALI
ncbi:MAG: hypothetical protein AUK24_03385 [Syntrophaceae bacterium CG2_30_49_12]|nr:MAG: hypothetical protein AUK24_03385 [Syntrophaceae bacterium CG2_30_49_12]PIP05283.1 MAG: hypothetical protein COX52_12865 [Syntrophobacterales bacterium CG23_combo_of_CG06-09_8_20_14_all_48_27]PJC74615.1 MAG: hypothetical protein CO012_05700 [Syntrophobacterales bacterium CG_4_8_14_3_um_filter_49_14]